MKANAGTGGTVSAGGAGGTGGGGTSGAPATGGSGGAGAAGGAGGTAGAATGGSGVGGSGGAPLGGMGGSAGGGAGTGTAGMAAGGGAGTGSTVWTCPSGITDTPTLGTPKRIAGLPPADDFNQMNNNFGNVEGPVWIGDSLYVSEMSYMAYDSTNSNVKKSRILKVASDGTVSIFIADSGSNGLATDSAGNIVATVHKDGSIKRFAFPSGTPSDVVTMYMGNRFDSPNDLAIRSDGTIYFSDPNFQAPNSLPQPKTLVYRVPPGGQATPISSDNFSNPNGVTLSLAEDYLYVAADSGKRYPVMADGSLGAGADFAAVSGGDGMTIDCAGNLYVAKANTQTVVVYKPDGNMIGTIMVPEVQAATNVAFGGADHKTLYITGLGNSKGLFQLAMNVPGRPY